jgi:hypothetical protein
MELLLPRRALFAGGFKALPAPVGIRATRTRLKRHDALYELPTIRSEAPLPDASAFMGKP